jgi:hypothetical protein
VTARAMCSEVEATENAARTIIVGMGDEIASLRDEVRELHNQLGVMTADRDRLHRQVAQLWEEGRLVAGYVSTFFTRTASAMQGREFPEPAPRGPYSVARGRK